MPLQRCDLELCAHISIVSVAWIFLAIDLYLNKYTYVCLIELLHSQEQNMLYVY